MNKKTETTITHAASIIRAINHKDRSMLLKWITENPGNNVTTIRVKTRIEEQSVCSAALAILRKAGFVTTERKGKEIFYSANTAYIVKVNSLLEQLQNLKA